MLVCSPFKSMTLLPVEMKQIKPRFYNTFLALHYPSHSTSISSLVYHLTDLHLGVLGSRMTVCQSNVVSHTFKVFYYMMITDLLVG